MSVSSFCTTRFNRIQDYLETITTTKQLSAVKNIVRPLDKKYILYYQNLQVVT